MTGGPWATRLRHVCGLWSPSLTLLPLLAMRVRASRTHFFNTPNPFIPGHYNIHASHSSLKPPHTPHLSPAIHPISLALIRHIHIFYSTTHAHADTLCTHTLSYCTTQTFSRLSKPSRFVLRSFFSHSFCLILSLSAALPFLSVVSLSSLLLLW